MPISFDQLVAQHGEVILRVCRTSLGAGPDADDAWSETFLAAFTAWPELQDDGVNVQAWLVRVAQRRCIDVLRSRFRHPQPTRDDASPVGVPHSDAGGGAQVQSLDLWRAVSELPERQRLAVSCHYLGGLSHTETAELLGSTPAAVRKAASDGVKKLRESQHLATQELTSERS